MENATGVGKAALPVQSSRRDRQGCLSYDCRRELLQIYGHYTNPSGRPTRMLDHGRPIGDLIG
jgi:hypothetical protein